MLSFFLFVRGLSILLTFYMCCLSSYSYGGYPSYLISIRTVFLSIRTGATPSTYFLYVLSFSLFVRVLRLLLIFYVGCLLRLCCYYRTYTRIHTRNEIPNLTPKISDLTRSFLPRRSSPSSLTTASTVLLLTPVNRLTSPSPLLPLSVRNPQSTRPSLLLLLLLLCPVKHQGIDTALLLPASTDSARRSLSSPMPSKCPTAPNNRHTPYMPRT